MGKSKRLRREQSRNSGLLDYTIPSTRKGMHLKNIKPKTENQQAIFDAYQEDQHLLLHGMAGTGKTFISMYLALRTLEEADSPFKKIVIMRSVVPTRDIGFLPGKMHEKIEVYEEPYKSICDELYDRGDAYDILKQKKTIQFMSTSFMRGITLKDAIVIVDEVNNLSFHELDTMITRLGDNARVIFCGDFRQTDLKSAREISGLNQFMNILNKLKDFTHVEFGICDIVRSGLVRDYIIAREQTV